MFLHLHNCRRDRKEDDKHLSVWPQHSPKTWSASVWPCGRRPATSPCLLSSTAASPPSHASMRRLVCLGESGGHIALFPSRTSASPRLERLQGQRWGQVRRRQQDQNHIALWTFLIINDPSVVTNHENVSSISTVTVKDDLSIFKTADDWFCQPILIRSTSTYGKI